MTFLASVLNCSVPVYMFLSSSDLMWLSLVDSPLRRGLLLSRAACARVLEPQLCYCRSNRNQHRLCLLQNVSHQSLLQLVSRRKQLHPMTLAKRHRADWLPEYRWTADPCNLLASVIAQHCPINPVGKLGSELSKKNPFHSL